MAVRVIAAIVLAAAFFGLTGFCVYLMIQDTGWIEKACGALILLLTLHTAYRFLKTYKQKKEDHG